MSNEKTLIFGHLNPDTDTVLSAITLSNLENNLGNNTTPCTLGDINEETKYALSYFNCEIPEKIDSIEEGTKVILVDVNESSQLLSDISKAKIIKVVDHHRMNFSTSDPIYYLCEPVGCTATIIYGLYKANNIEVTKQIAGLLLSCIISDTLLFKSPTCTPKDIKFAEELSKLAQVDVNTYGLDMLKAGTDTSIYSAEEIIHLDAKGFQGDNYSFVVAQVNTADINDVFNRKEELTAAIKADIFTNKLDLFILLITDVINTDSRILALGNKNKITEKAFGETLDSDDSMFLKGIVSRKKQVAPPLLELFEKE